MKKTYPVLMLVAGTIGSLAFMSSKSASIEIIKGSHLNIGGAPSGRTGAPGEGNCTDCHTGSVQSGAANSLTMTTTTGTIVTSYIPGTTYNVGVTFAGAGARNGFEVVALRADNDAQAGTVNAISGSGAQIINGSAGKQYVTHTLAGNAMTAWAFQWTAPATNVGNVKFYLATNQTNSSNTPVGDIIRLSQHTFGSTAGIAENKSVELNVGFASSTGQLVIDLSTLSTGSAYINLVDLSGKSVFHEDLGAVSIGENQLKVRLPETVTSGIYVAHISVNNNFNSQKLAIQR